MLVSFDDKLKPKYQYPSPFWSVFITDISYLLYFPYVCVCFVFCSLFLSFSPSFAHFLSFPSLYLSICLPISVTKIHAFQHASQTGYVMIQRNNNFVSERREVIQICTVLSLTDLNKWYSGQLFEISNMENYDVINKIRHTFKILSLIIISAHAVHRPEFFMGWSIFSRKNWNFYTFMAIESIFPIESKCRIMTIHHYYIWSFV